MQNKSIVSNLVGGVANRVRSYVTPENPAQLGWMKKKYMKHLPPGRVRFFRHKNIQFYFTDASEALHTYEEIFVQRIYDAALSSNAFIIDCGANIGLSTIFFKSIAPDSEIIAFEPDVQNCNLLRQNIQVNGITNVSIREEAVWTENGTIHFTGEGNMSSRIDTSAGVNAGSVVACRLKDLLTRKVDFLKIDIEGAEYAVMQDIRDNLHFVDNLFLEYHGRFSQCPELTELFNILTSQGFYYYVKEAASIYRSPFYRQVSSSPYDIQLNIFAFKNNGPK